MFALAEARLDQALRLKNDLIVQATALIRYAEEPMVGQRVIALAAVRLVAGCHLLMQMGQGLSEAQCWKSRQNTHTHTQDK